MADIISSRLIEGIWRAEVAKLGDPTGVTAHCNDQVLDTVTVSPIDVHKHLIELAIPASILSDGAHSILITDAEGQNIASISILAGSVVSDDIRSELSLLRAELDMLKQAFRKSQTAK